MFWKFPTKFPTSIVYFLTFSSVFYGVENSAANMLLLETFCCHAEERLNLFTLYRIWDQFGKKWQMAKFSVAKLIKILHYATLRNIQQ